MMSHDVVEMHIFILEKEKNPVFGQILFRIRVSLN